SKRKTSRPASRSTSRARCGCPAASSPGSVTTSTRLAPTSRVSSPSRAMPPAPKTTRVSGWKSNAGGPSARPARRPPSRPVGDSAVVRCMARLRGEEAGGEAALSRLLGVGLHGQVALPLQGARAEQEVDDTPLVRLQPVELDRRDGPEVQPVDVGGVEQLAL